MAVVAYGLILNKREALKTKENLLVHFWDMVYYITTTIIFVYSGVTLMKRAFISKQVNGYDWLYLILLYLFVILARIIVVIVL